MARVYFEDRNIPIAKIRAEIESINALALHFSNIINRYLPKTDTVELEFRLKNICTSIQYRCEDILRDDPIVFLKKIQSLAIAIYGENGLKETCKSHLRHKDYDVVSHTIFNMNDDINSVIAKFNAWYY